MIRTERLLEIWDKSPHLAPFPEFLKEIITASYSQKRDQKLSAGAVAYLQNHRQQLVPVLESSFLNYSIQKLTARSLLQKVRLSVIRNLLVIFHVSSYRAAGKFDHLPYPDWHKRNLVAAFLARHMARNQPGMMPEEACLLTYLQDISLMVLSRTLPEVYAKLVQLQAEKKYRVRDELQLLETDHGALSALWLENWGIPREALRAVQLHHDTQALQRQENQVMRLGHLLRLSQALADIILGFHKNVDYRQVESQFNQYLKIAPATLQQILVDFVNKLPELGETFGFPDLAHLSLIRLIQSNQEFLQKKIIPYERLLEEISTSRERIQEMEREISYLKEQIRQQSFLDTVTGVYNYSYVYETLSREISQATRYEYPITFILFDVDNFSLFNQVYGAASGDQLLKKIAQRVAKNVRQSDVLGRWNADRFAMVLPHTGQPQAHYVAQKICRLIADQPFPDDTSNRMHRVTVSVGVMTILPSVYYLQREVLVRKVEQALEKARQAGGNRWVDGEKIPVR